MLKAFIFDIDGTLVDSVDFHAEAWQRALAHFGHAVSFHAVRSQIGKGGDQLMPVFLSEEELEHIGEELERYRSELFKREYLPRVRAFPGTRALFKRIREDGKQIVLASSSKADEVAVYKRIAQIEDLVDGETSADDVEVSKPAADIFRAALGKLHGVRSYEALVVGDSPYDPEAAGKVGLATIGVLSGGFPEEDLRAACFAIFRDPEDLFANYDAAKEAFCEQALQHVT